MAIGALGVLIAALTPTSPSFTVTFIVGTVLAAVLLGSIMSIQKWKKFPWLPLSGIAVATLGYLLDVFDVSVAGMLMFSLFCVWQGHKLERRGMSEARSRV
ncbi:hypothetical protein [Kocuria atrinae]|uniref:Uncharacterized protein n=1 Tax=Kocuria atrinae TaxID=592377 RepID=A0ABP5JJS2_9MICC|nr:hypothetical protein [Kocuria sp.]